MVKRIGLLVLVLMFTISGVAFAAVEVGDQLPDFTVTDMEGNEALVSDFWSNYVLIDVWATWCGPCVKAMKSYKQNYDKFEQAGIQIVAISVDSKIEAPKDYAVKNELPFTILHTSGKLTKEHWGVRGIPTMYLIDAEGNILFKEVGFSDFAELWENISKIVDVTGVSTEKLPEFKADTYATKAVEIDYNALSKDLTLSFVNSDTLDLQAEAVAELVEPEYAHTPQYGMVTFAGHNFALAAVDSDQSGMLDQLYVDFNGNNDLTDDGEPLQYETFSSYTEVEFIIETEVNGVKIPVIVTTYSHSSGNKYYAMNGLGYEAEIQTDGQPVKVMLVDGNVNGLFTDAEDALLMDLSGNGVFDSFSTKLEWSTLEEAAKKFQITVAKDGQEIIVK